MSTVFISHASEDADLAEDLFHALEGAGYTAYLDKKTLTTGQEYNVAIQDLVAKSDFFVFLISPESIQQGAYTLTELKYAEEKWRRQPEWVVPVMIRPVELKALPSFLRMTTYLSPKGNATAEVVSELNRRSQGEREGVISRADREARAKTYFNEELQDRSTFYEHASLMSARHYRMLQTLTVACALAIPLILYLPFDIGDWGRLIASFMGAILIFLVVHGILGNHQVKSFRYCLAAERMNRERRKYVNFTAPYTAGLGENRAYALFVENVEQILQDEQRT